VVFSPSFVNVEALADVKRFSFWRRKKCYFDTAKCFRVYFDVTLRLFDYVEALL
jgi:hypothetical protein